MKTVLITGARAPIALEMSRSFAQYGCQVIMADSQRFTIARWSNTVKKYYLLPSARYDIELYIKELNEIIKKENVSHLIPTCEEAFYCALHKDKINCQVWTSDETLMNNLHNKLTFTAFASAYFPIPATIKVSDFLDWEQSDAYVFKPIYSRFATGTIIGKKLTASYFSEKEKSNWIAQKRIKGKEICIYSIWDSGILKAYSAYHPLYRVGKGSGVYFEPVQHQKTFDLVKNFGENIKYTGQLCFDVIIDDSDTPYFIECNPRGTSGAHLINEKIAACYLENKDLVIANEDEYCLKYAMAVLHPLAYFSKRVRAARDVIYQKNDKKPFFLQFLSLFEITFIKFTKRISWLEATTGDTEWNGYED